MQIGQLIFKQEFLFLSVCKNPSSVLVSFFVLYEVEVFLFPDLFDFVEFFFVFKLLDSFVDNFEDDLFVLLEIECKYLVKGHGFDGDFEFVTCLSHKFFPMSVSDGAILQLNDERNGVFEG